MSARMKFIGGSAFFYSFCTLLASLCVYVVGGRLPMQLGTAAILGKDVHARARHRNLAPDAALWESHRSRVYPYTLPVNVLAANGNVARALLISLIGFAVAALVGGYEFTRRDVA